VDFFHTLEQRIVSTLGGAKILGSVNALGPASPYYNQVAFGNFPGQPGATPTGPAGSLDGNFAAVFYIDNLLNIGAARVEGWDLSAHYNLDLQTMGQFEFGLNAVVFTENDLKSDPFVPYYNISGLVGSEFGFVGGANPDYKITALVEYRYQGLTLGLNANYIPEMRNAVGHDPETEDQNTFDKVDDYVTVDGRISYLFTRKTAAPAAVTDAKDAKDGKAVAATPGVETCNLFDRLVDGLRLTVGCNNILDEDPRLVRGANSGTSLSTYDPFGRFVYFEVSHKF
jgi:iron complex outermembrane receptor protein